MFTERFQKYDFPKLGLVRLPKVNFNNELRNKYNIDAKASNFEVLKALGQNGLNKKLTDSFISKDQVEIYQKRLDYELQTFEELGFTDYILLVWVIVDKARSNGAFIDFSRGSCGGSLFFWLTEMAGADPISKGLFFERFISKTRSKKQIIDGEIYLQGDLIADVDLNLGKDREKIVEWLNEEYKGKVCKIAGLNTYTGKILIKDTYKAVDLATEDQAKELADLIDKQAGFVDDISETPEKNEYFRDWVKKYPNTYLTALKLRDLLRVKSSHAAGYLISYDPLDGFVPFELNKEKDRVISYEKEAASSFAIKLDLLGLTTNEIVGRVIKDRKIDVSKLNLDNDTLIYDQFQSGNLLPYGLYQISADFLYRICNEIKPKNILELSDASAIARPGAIMFLGDYVNNNAEVLHETFKNALKTTRGLCLYQEQLMKMAHLIGFSLEDAEIMRKIVGKKKVEQVKEWKQKIFDKVKENKFEVKVAEVFWDILERSAKYSFNFSHSLNTSYMSALTVYLKYKYPLDFYISCLKSTKDLPNYTEHISLIQKELNYFNIKLLPPHIIHSDIDFKVENGNIRFGLSYIKGNAEKTIQKLNDFRANYSTKLDVFMGAEQAGLNVGTLSSLIYSGCLDDVNDAKSRSKLVYEWQVYHLLKEKEKLLIQKHAPNFDFDVIKALKHVKELKDDKGKPFIKDSRFETIRKHSEDYKQLYLYNSKHQEFCNFYFEKKLLGYSHTTSLMDVFQETCGGDLISIQKVNSSLEKDRVHFVGTVSDFKEGVSRAKGTKYLKLTVEDDGANSTVMLFNDKITYHQASNGKKAEKGDIVIVRGKKMGDAVFADAVGVQNIQIFERVSNLKDKD